MPIYNKTMLVEAVRRAGYDVPSMRAAHYDYAYTQDKVRTNCLRWFDRQGVHHTAYQSAGGGDVLIIDNVPVAVPQENKNAPDGAGTTVKGASR